MEQGKQPAISSTGVVNDVKVKEGKAEICFPDSNSVFYNPVQEFNRDLSTAVLRLFSQEFFPQKKVTKRKNSPINGAEQKEDMSEQDVYVCRSEVQTEETSSKYAYI